MQEQNIVFDSFPEECRCKLCGKVGGKNGVLVRVAYTEEDGNCEAIPVHLECLVDKTFFYRETGLFIASTGRKQHD